MVALASQSDSRLNNGDNEELEDLKSEELRPVGYCGRPLAAASGHWV